MNRLQGYSRSLREVFEQAITARYITSSLASFDFERTAWKIRDWLQRKDFDQVGVRRDGVVVGYALTSRLQNRTLGFHLMEFSEENVVPADLPILDALQRVRYSGSLFVQVLGEVHGIITPADALKPPVRIWLFGLLTVFEMQVSRLLRARYPTDACFDLLPKPRGAPARGRWKKRREEETHTTPIDCLYLPDKGILVAATPEIVALSGLGSAEWATTLFGRIVTLRNKLSHADDVADEWPGFLDLASEVELLITTLERVTTRQLKALSQYSAPPA
jgi:hypothetical protein